MRSKTDTTKSRDLRKRSTAQEVWLWNFLRNRRLVGVKFRRQHPIAHYIADFCCTEGKLVIEIDGGIHDTSYQKQYDRERDRVLQDLGYQVLRLRNDEIDQNMEKVIEKLTSFCSPLAQYGRGAGGEGATGDL